MACPTVTYNLGQMQGNIYLNFDPLSGKLELQSTTLRGATLADESDAISGSTNISRLSSSAN